jgi:hypothetical protein
MSLFNNFLRKKIPFDEPVLETVTLTFSNVSGNEEAETITRDTMGKTHHLGGVFRYVPEAEWDSATGTLTIQFSLPADQ